MYCFKKEEEFKELLENLEIENIEIDLTVKQNPSQKTPIEMMDKRDDMNL